MSSRRDVREAFINGAVCWVGTLHDRNRKGQEPPSLAEVTADAMQKFPDTIEAEPSTIPGKWQHQIVGCKGNVDVILAQFGEDGWEVCAYLGQNPEQGLMFVMKRPKRLIEVASAGAKLS